MNLFYYDHQVVADLGPTPASMPVVSHPELSPQFYLVRTDWITYVSDLPPNLSLQGSEYRVWYAGRLTAASWKLRILVYPTCSPNSLFLHPPPLVPQRQYTFRALRPHPATCSPSFGGRRGSELAWGARRHVILVGVCRIKLLAGCVCAWSFSHTLRP